MCCVVVPRYSAREESINGKRIGGMEESSVHLASGSCLLADNVSGVFRRE